MTTEHAGASPVQRPVRPLVERLRTAAGQQSRFGCCDEAALLREGASEIDRLCAALDRALTVCRCAARVVDSSAYQGVSDEDCDMENAVRNWRHGA